MLRLVPESPRWLLAVGRKKEAAGVLENAAKCNNLCSKKIHLTLTNLLDQDVNITKPSISTLFAVKELKSRTILLCINWYCINLIVLFEIKLTFI